MKKKYGYSVVVLVFTLVLPLYAQTDSKEQEAFSLIEKVTQKIQVSKDLTYQMTYRLFEDYQSSKVKESYDGLFKKQGSKRYYTKIDQTEFIQDGSGVMVKVFHDEKVIMASDLELQVGVSVLDMNQLKSYFKVSKLQERSFGWYVELVSYEFTSLPFGKVELHISKDLNLQKQVFYYITAVDQSIEFGESDLIYPRLEVDYSNYSTKSLSLNDFPVSRYIFKSGDSTLELQRAYSNFKLIDQRKK